MTDPQIAETARKLTAVQRNAVRRGGIGDETMATINALWRKGLMHLRIDSPDGRCGFMELTAKGQSVAAYLKEQSK